MNTLTNKRVLLGVSGSIAAYKSPDIVRRLQDLGAEVRVIVTDGGKEFVSERSLQTISKNKVYSNLWDKEAELAMGHIELAKWSDIVIIAPASANTIAKLCHGRADDLLSTVILATDAKVMLAPSMNQKMFASNASDYTGQGKNVPAGTAMTGYGGGTPKSYHFHLASHGGCGTLNPKFYQVIHDDNGIVLDNMVAMAYALTMDSKRCEKS